MSLIIQSTGCPEKIEPLVFDSIRRGVIPIIFGADKESYLEFLPEDSFVHYSEFFPKDGTKTEENFRNLLSFDEKWAINLLNLIKNITQNEKNFNDYFAWRSNEKILKNLKFSKKDDFQFNGFCGLCNLATELLEKHHKVGVQPQSKVITNFTKIWYDENNKKCVY